MEKVSDSRKSGVTCHNLSLENNWFFIFPRRHLFMIQQVYHYVRSMKVQFFSPNLQVVPLTFADRHVHMIIKHNFDGYAQAICTGPLCANRTESYHLTEYQGS